MTDEEMAEEYCDNEVPFDTTESGEKLYTQNDLKYAYLAGLKAGKGMAGAVETTKELQAQIEQLVYLHNEDVNTIKLLNERVEEMKRCEICKYKEDLALSDRSPCNNCNGQNWELDD